MSLVQKIKEIPATPGVYLMKDSLGQVIYVGKSKHLRQRVQSYFRESSSHSNKVRKLVKHIHDLEIIETDTEFEALLLEWQLIQEIRPQYNRQMKTPEAFLYLTIRKVGKLYRLRPSTQPLRGGDGWSFGPYTSRKTVSFAIRGLKDVYRLDCSNPAINGSPCLNYSLGLCRGICLGGKAVGEYNAIVEQLIALLNGESAELLEDMQREMNQLAADLDFERAARYRNCIQSLQALLQKEDVMDFTEGNHLMLVAEKLDEQRVKCFLIRRTDVFVSEVYGGENGIDEEVLQKITARLSGELTNAAPAAAREVSRFEIDKAQIIYSYLRSGKCKYKMVGREDLDALDAVISDVFSGE
ncbi:GIY-YIG nuclease family protein [Sutcliffiella horikoshii]|uniref:GIY-YIG nuclease family protein n=1 Tax=Sutcliffiella horikoshii TaxID=79883 RepID=UPI001CBA8CB1|nr:GIY-YIG nuclease family protein [Sutcliffiella horikoshii]UAL48086.1 GIY-YIG nuclease family protein [Sutcliffiella horikoshii]